MIKMRYLWVGGEGTVVKYDISEENRRTVAARIKCHSEAVTSVIELDQQIITSSIDSTIKVWKQKGKEFGCLHTMQAESPTAAAILVPECNSLFTCGATVKVWGMEGWYNSCTTDTHKQPIRSLAAFVGGDNMLLASGSQDKSQKVWKIEAY